MSSRLTKFLFHVLNSIVLPFHCALTGSELNLIWLAFVNGRKKGKIKDFDTNESKQMSSLSALIDCQLKVDWSSRSIIIWQTVLTRVWVGKSFVNKFVNKSKESWVTEGLLELSLLLPNSAVCNKSVYILWYTHRWHSSPQPRPINQTIFWSIDCALSRLDSMSPSKRISRAAARHLESAFGVDEMRFNLCSRKYCGDCHACAYFTIWCTQFTCMLVCHSMWRGKARTAQLMTVIFYKLLCGLFFALFAQ